MNASLFIEKQFENQGTVLKGNQHIEVLYIVLICMLKSSSKTC